MNKRIVALTFLAAVLAGGTLANAGATSTLATDRILIGSASARLAAGDLPTSRTANLTTRRCTKPASPVTSLLKIATTSSPVTRLRPDAPASDVARRADEVIE